MTKQKTNQSTTNQQDTINQQDSQPEQVYDMTNDVEFHSRMDVGDLYALINNSKTSLDQLLVIKEAGINLGHDGIIDSVYGELTARELKRKGASEEHISAYRHAKSNQDFGEIRGILQIYSIREAEPDTKELYTELDRALKNAAGTRGYSIHDESTAVGRLYQKRFGKDFENIQIPLNVDPENVDPEVERIEIAGTIVPIYRAHNKKTNEEVIIVMYKDLPNYDRSNAPANMKLDKNTINKHILTSRGYLAQEQGAEAENENSN